MPGVGDVPLRGYVHIQNVDLNNICRAKSVRVAGEMEIAVKVRL